MPGAASALPRPTSRPGSSSNRVSRVTENITYQATRTVKKTRLPAGAVRKMSLAVLVDQTVDWQKQGAGYKRVLVPPEADKLKLKAIVAKAHQQGRRVRFWGAPDQPVFWGEMLANGVDLINTDDLDGAQKFLLKN